MAQPTTDRERLLKQAKGLSYLRTGEVPRDDAFDAYNDRQLLLQINEYRTAIEQNWDLDVPPAEQNLDEPVSFGVEQPAAPVGTRDRLTALINTELSDGGVLPASDAIAVKSVMSVAGYDVDLENGTFSAEEEAALARFRDNMNLFSLQEMARRNFAAAAAGEAETLRLQQEQEALELSQAELKGSVASMLVYNGYLAPEDADNDMRIATAMNHAITIYSTHEDQIADQRKMFVDFENWQLTDEAAIYLRTNMDGFTPQTADLSGDLLRSHLESGDPDLIKLAQGYLINQPGNEEVVINGTVDQATYDAGLRELQTPVELPAGVYNTDGSIRGDRLMQYAVDGQLYLPVDQLSAEDRALYDSLPFAADRQPGDVNCKERLLASRLILEDPEGYAQLLAEHNATIRANATLDVPIELPVVAVPPTATIAEEQFEIANNPAGLLDNPDGDALYDAAQPIVDSIKENGIGVTDRSGFVVFEGQPVALSGIVEALKLDQGAFGDGNADNLISMSGAISLVRGSVSVHDVGMTMASNPLTPDDAWAINESLGYDRYHSFDINNPVEMQALLNGIITYQNVTGAGFPVSESFIAEHSGIDREDVKNAVGIASGVIPAQTPATPVTEPENDGTVDISALRTTFGSAHDDVRIVPDRAPRVAIADNINGPVQKLDIA